ncbi:tetratricopeptide repeat protein [Microbulbifer sediminum]|uniref:tetratricopeptide repeat protein n=1 Tax=Microbulbifer sediminum TaxID=2904250 RepID=UPI001F2EDD94|nr:tetratricopeptide repeat protein [Microbulbifer sediminum]
MATACHYHPANRAAFSCEHCARGFCAHCFPGTTATPGQSHRCPRCRRALSPIAGNGTGRWFRALPAVLLHPIPLILLALAAAVSIFLPAGPQWLLPVTWGLVAVLILLFFLKRRSRTAAAKALSQPNKTGRQATQSTGGRDREDALARVKNLSIEGDYNGARRVLMDAMRRYNNDPELNERYYRLLLVSKDTRSLRELAPHLLEKLVRLNRGHKAAKLYLATTPRPAIDKSHLRHALAEALFQQRKFHEAARLLKNLHREDSHYRQLEAAYLLLARIYLEGLKRPEDASRLLLYLRREFPQGRLTRQVQSLQKCIANTQRPA